MSHRYFISNFLFIIFFTQQYISAKEGHLLSFRTNRGGMSSDGHACAASGVGAWQQWIIDGESQKLVTCFAYF
jgi:hypothetical protein